MTKQISMMDENRNSLFTEKERDTNQRTEQIFLAKARLREFVELFLFGKKSERCLFRGRLSVILILLNK